MLLLHLDYRVCSCSFCSLLFEYPLRPPWQVWYTVGVGRDLLCCYSARARVYIRPSPHTQCTIPVKPPSRSECTIPPDTSSVIHLSSPPLLSVYRESKESSKWSRILAYLYVRQCCTQCATMVSRWSDRKLKETLKGFRWLADYLLRQWKLDRPSERTEES